MNAAPRIDPDRLLKFATAAYAAAGLPGPDAHLCADTLVQADLWGHQSHGVMRLFWYTLVDLRKIATEYGWRSYCRSRA
jgi:LDH2 family malate/lactate/ureidoglycolate dehydrogenase